MSEVNSLKVLWDEYQRGNYDSEWKQDYNNFHLEVKSLLNNPSKFNDEEFLKEFLYAHANGIASGATARTSFSEEKFKYFIKNKDFINVLKDVFSKEITHESYKRFYDAWRVCAESCPLLTSTGNPDTNNAPFFINRAIAAATLDVSSTANQGDFNRLFKCLTKEKIIKENPKQEDLENWFTKNVWLISKIREELVYGNSDEEKIIVNCFLWWMANKVKNKKTLLLNGIGTDDISKRENNMPSHLLNQILYGPPGTGKTYNIIEKVKEILVAYGEDEEEIEKNIKSLKDLDSDRYKFVTFHPAYGYEEFIEGIRPITKKDKVLYSVESGIFKQLCEDARANLTFSVEDIMEEYINSFDEDQEIELETPKKKKKFRIKITGNDTIACWPESSKKESWEDCDRLNPEIKKFLKKENYVWRSYVPVVSQKILEYAGIENFNQEENVKKPYFMIIDEINRGNIPKIFGELITLIEDTKRDSGEDEDVEYAPATLTYSGKPFTVPDNVHIIATMNTADKSLVSLDIALRRRFTFIEMMPDMQALQNKLPDDLFWVVGMLEKINKNIDKELQRTHQIGHAYFIRCKEQPDVKRALMDKIIPLLQEYTYDDWKKVEKIVGFEINEPVNFEVIADTMIINAKKNKISGDGNKEIQISSSFEDLVRKKLKIFMDSRENKEDAMLSVAKENGIQWAESYDGGNTGQRAMDLGKNKLCGKVKREGYCFINGEKVTFEQK